jgi:hypothetical protein
MENIDKNYKPESCETCKHLTKTKSYIHTEEKPDFYYFCNATERGKEVTLYVTTFQIKTPHWCPLKQK